MKTSRPFVVIETQPQLYPAFSRFIRFMDQHGDAQARNASTQSPPPTLDPALAIIATSASEQKDVVQPRSVSARSFTVIPREELMPLIQMAHRDVHHPNRGGMVRRSNSSGDVNLLSAGLESSSSSSRSSHQVPFAGSFAHSSSVAPSVPAVPPVSSYPPPTKPRLQRHSSAPERPLFHPYSIRGAPRRRINVIMHTPTSQEHQSAEPSTSMDDVSSHPSKS
jgi:hypothetical protein